MTLEMVKRAEKEWSALAGEPVTITYTEDWLYAHGSEIAVLRIYWKMRGEGRVEKRPNGWVYFKEVKF